MILKVEDKMECVICKNGTTQPGLATVTLENNKSVVVIKVEIEVTRFKAAS